MHSDFKDLLSTFNDHGVEYLVVGAHALAAHGLIRATKDLDVFVRPHPENARRVFQALTAFGAPLAGLSPADFEQPGMILQIGVPPVRVDILTAIDAVAFEDAFAGRIEANFGGVRVGVLSRRDLIANKRSAGRKQDLADVEWLEQNRP